MRASCSLTLVPLSRNKRSGTMCKMGKKTTPIQVRKRQIREMTYTYTYSPISRGKHLWECLVVRRLLQGTSNWLVLGSSVHELLHFYPLMVRWTEMKQKKKKKTFKFCVCETSRLHAIKSNALFDWVISMYLI